MRKWRRSARASSFLVDRAAFHRILPPTDDDIAALLTRLHRRVRRLLTQRGRLPQQGDGGTDPFAAQEPLFATTVAAALQGHIALGLRAGQLLRRLRSATAVVPTGRRCAPLEGSRPHAAVAGPAHRRARLEHLGRDLVRPPLARARLTESSGRQLLSPRRRPWSDGSTALLVDPLERLERLTL